MTQIGSVTLDIPVAYRRSGYTVSMMGSQNDSEGFNELRELFAKAEFGTAIHAVPGERPFGEDLTDDLSLTQYVIFTHGTSGKPQDGYYLLRPGHSFVEDRTPEGHSYVWSINLFFLGTDSFYQNGFVVKGMTDVATEKDDNGWGI